MKRFIQELSRDEQRLGVKIATGAWVIMTLLYWLTGAAPLVVSILAGAVSALVLLYTLALGFEALRSIETRLSILSTISIVTVLISGHVALSLTSHSPGTELQHADIDQPSLSDPRTKLPASWNTSQTHDQDDTRFLWLTLFGFVTYGAIRVHSYTEFQRGVLSTRDNTRGSLTNT